MTSRRVNASISGGTSTAGGGLGGLAGLLDADGDGNPLDDILGRLRR